MSIDKSRVVERGHSSLFRRAIRLVLCSSLLAVQPADTVAIEPVQEQEKEDYDDGLYYKGIKKGSDKKPKKKPIEVDPIDDPSCTYNTCKHA
jgi:hypothetical protein